jgi:hypothetical protein
MSMPVLVRYNSQPAGFGLTSNGQNGQPVVVTSFWGSTWMVSIPSGATVEIIWSIDSMNSYTSRDSIEPNTQGTHTFDPAE